MHKVPLAVIAALDDEIRNISSRMSVDSRIHVRPGLITKGTYGQRPLVLVRTGVGRQAMRSTISSLLANHRPELIIHTGYCGGAEPTLAPGDIVLADRVVDSRDGAVIECDEAIVARASKLLKDRSMRARVGSLVTVDEVASSPHDKAFLATQHGSIGIDMESSEFAIAAGQAGIPFLVARAVLDPLDYEVPDLCDAMDENGSTDGIALAEHLVKKPADVLKLPRLQYMAAQARGAIHAFIDAWLQNDGRNAIT